MSGPIFLLEHLPKGAPSRAPPQSPCFRVNKPSLRHQLTPAVAAALVDAVVHSQTPQT